MFQYLFCLKKARLREGGRSVPHSPTLPEAIGAAEYGPRTVWMDRPSSMPNAAFVVKFA